MKVKKGKRIVRRPADVDKLIYKNSKRQKYKKEEKKDEKRYEVKVKRKKEKKN